MDRLVCVLPHEQKRDDAAGGLGSACLQPIAQQMVEVLRAVLAPYRLSEEEAIHAIRSLRSMVHGFSSLEAAGAFGMPVDLDASFHWLISLFLAIT